MSKWGRANGYNCCLLESLIHAGPCEGGWADFVAVFLKDEAHASLHPNRIMDDGRVNYKNGFVYGSDSVLKLDGFNG